MVHTRTTAPDALDTLTETEVLVDRLHAATRELQATVAGSRKVLDHSRDLKQTVDQIIRRGFKSS